MEKVYLLPENVLHGILNYLSLRPWKEVDAGIKALTSLEEYLTEEQKTTAKATMVEHY